MAVLTTPQRAATARVRQSAGWFFRFSKTKPLGAAGIVIIFCLVVMALTAPYVSPYDPKDPGYPRVLQPNEQHWLGTDNLGRDVFSRVLWGSRISLYIGVTSVLIGISIGTIVGIVTGYIGGPIDLLLQRLVDALASFPSIILALGIVAALGQSVTNIVIVIAILMFPGGARVIRGVTLSIKETVYVDSARAIGASDFRIMFRHILPNCMAPYLILISVNVGFAIIVEASLSFLGAGTPPEVPTWGNMVNLAAKNFFSGSIGLTLAPGIGITLAVLSFNLVGDALRDVLDPRLRGTQ